MDWPSQAVKKDPGRSVMIPDISHPPSKERTGKERDILFSLEHSDTQK